MSAVHKMKPFWMVYGAGQHGPAHRHETEDSARREAELLADLRPGTTFVVLQAVEAVRLRKFDRVDLRGPASARGRPSHDVDDDIPF